MNDGVTACIAVLHSVFDHFDSGKGKLAALRTAEVVDRIERFGVALGRELGSYSLDQRREFRRLRGVEGQTARMRRLQQVLHEKYPEFIPAGLKQFIEQERAQTTEKAAAVIGDMERMLQKHVVDQLKLHFPANPDDWWYEGVPPAVRAEVVARMEDDKNQRGGRDKYFDLIHYRAIAVQNWAIFQDTLDFDKAGNKEKRTAWLVMVNDMRRKVMHASSGVLLSQEQLVKLDGYLEWLRGQLGENSPEGEEVGVGNPLADGPAAI